MQPKTEMGGGSPMFTIDYKKDRGGVYWVKFSSGQQSIVSHICAMIYGTRREEKLCNDLSL